MDCVVAQYTSRYTSGRSIDKRAALSMIGASSVHRCAYAKNGTTHLLMLARTVRRLIQ